MTVSSEIDLSDVDFRDSCFGNELLLLIVVLALVVTVLFIVALVISEVVIVAELAVVFAVMVFVAFSLVLSLSNAIEICTPKPSEVAGLVLPVCTEIDSGSICPEAANVSKLTSD